MNDDLLYVLLGLAAGTLSGLIGIGGGVIIVPALVLLFGFSQHQAQGTTLALMVPPIGLPAAWAYYKHGSVNFEVALLVYVGFFIGGVLRRKAGDGYVQRDPGTGFWNRAGCDRTQDALCKVRHGQKIVLSCAWFDSWHFLNRSRMHVGFTNPFSC